MRGIGNAGGVRMMIQDRAGLGSQALQGAVMTMVGKAAQIPGLTQVFSLFETSTPQLYLDIDRTKAQMLGINVSDVFGALQTYLGSTYVNDFNLLGRTFRVTAQADAPYRLDTKDVLKIRVRNSRGDTVPLGSFTTVRDTSGPYRVPRHNLYPAAELDASTLPGFSQGQAIARAARSWPPRRCPMASATSGPRWRSSRSGPAARRSSPSCWPWCSCSWCWRRSTRA